MLDEANGPERGHGEESGDGPALSSERRSARAYFAADEAEEGWGDESDQEDEKEDRLEDEDEGAGVPARIKRKKGEEAVVIGPVKQEGTEEGDEGKAVEQAPAYGGRGRLAGGGLTGAPAVEEPDRTDDDRGLEWEAKEGVGPAAMMLEGSDRAVDGPEEVEVGDFGRERHGDGGVGCLAIKPGSGEAGSGHQVGYGVHSFA